LIAIAAHNSDGHHHPGAAAGDAEGYAAFYAPALSSVQRLNTEKEATTMDIPDDLPAGQ